MSPAAKRVFVARLAGLAVFDPIGDRVGRVRDVIVVFRAGRQHPRAVGLVVEVPGRRRVFVPMTRVTSMDAGQVITTGLVNMRRFEQRPTETLVLGELFDRTVRLRPNATGTAGAEGADGEQVTVEDEAIAQVRSREWRLTRVFV
ncbi:MAG: PRC-barrel domain-containing protein, partial [Kineosporiaceae bacterium]